MNSCFKYAKLKGRIIERFGTQKAFAEAVGIAENTLSLKLNDKMGISKEDILTWSTLLGISIEEYGSFYFE